MSITDSYVSDELWTEKYRPKTIDDLVADESFKNRLKAYINDPTKMNHQLFIGPPGSGKTTSARILIDNIIHQRDDLIVFNGSEQKGIQIVRDHIKHFVTRPALFSPIKIVFIDEADNLTPDAWKSLRFIMENYSENCRFLFTGNYDNFPDYIKSRCSLTKFTALNKSYMLNFTEKILHNENITYKVEDLKYIIDIFYPDLRKIVATLQELSVTGTLDISNIENVISNEEKLVMLTLDVILYGLRGDTTNTNLKIIEISSLISSRYIDYSKVYTNLFSILSFEAIPIKVLVAKHSAELNRALVPAMSYYSFIYELNNELKKLVGKLDPNIIVKENDNAPF